jgi:hypothetical protein
MMVLVYILLGLYLVFRGAREAGWSWANSRVVEGVLLFLTGLILLLAQLI